MNQNWIAVVGSPRIGNPNIKNRLEEMLLGL
jgi:hypothetical protein